MLAVVRLRLKIFTSFAIAALGAAMLVRLAGEMPLSAQSVWAYVIAAVFCLAGVWRGVIYLRAARAGARSGAGR